MKKFDGAFLDLSGYEVFFEDDFSSYQSIADFDYRSPANAATAKWIPWAPYEVNFGWGDEQFRPDMLSFTPAIGVNTPKILKITAERFPIVPNPIFLNNNTTRNVYYKTGIIRSAPLSNLDRNAFETDANSEFYTGFKYGVFEMRAKMPPATFNRGIWATFWLFGRGVEIDVIDGITSKPESNIENAILVAPIIWDKKPEVTTQWEDKGLLSAHLASGQARPPDYISEQYYYNGDQVVYTDYLGDARVYQAKEFIRPTIYSNRPGMETNMLEDKFNTYTLVWTPTEIVFFINGYKIYSQTTAYTELALAASTKSNYGAFPGVCSIYIGLQMSSWANVQTAEMEIEYVRVYKPINYTPPGPGVGPPYLYPQDPTKYNFRFHDKTTLFNNLASLNSHLDGNSYVENADSDLIVSPDGKKVYHRNAENNRLNHFYWADPNPNDGNNAEKWNYGSLDWLYTNVMGNVVHHPTEERLFYRGKINVNNNNRCSVFCFYFDPSNITASPSGWVNENLDIPGNPVIDDVADNIVVSPIDGKQVYYRNKNGNICYFEKDVQSSKWVHYSPLVVAALGNLVHSPSLSKKIYYRGMDNHLWNIYFDGSIWKSGFLDPLYNINNVAGDLVHSPFSETIYYRGTDSKIYFFYFESGGWKHACLHTLANLTNGDAQGYLLLHPTNNQLFYRDGNGHLLNFYLENGVWKHGCLDWNITNVAANKFCITAEGTRIFYKGTDGRLHLFYFLDDSNGHGRWYSRSMQHEGSNNVANDIAISAGGKPFYIGTEGKIWNYYDKWSGNYDFADERISID